MPALQVAGRGTFPRVVCGASTVMAVLGRFLPPSPVRSTQAACAKRACAACGNDYRVPSSVSVTPDSSSVARTVSNPYLRRTAASAQRRLRGVA